MLMLGDEYDRLVVNEGRDWVSFGERERERDGVRKMLSFQLM